MGFHWLWTAYAHGWGELPYECCKEKSKELCPCKENVSKQLDVTPLDSKPNCSPFLCLSTSHYSAFWIKFLICSLEEYWHFLYQKMCLKPWWNAICSLCGCQISFLRIGVIPFKFSYAVLLQYRVESPIEFPSWIVYQLSDVSDRFPKISIGGLKWIFPL